VRLLRDIWDGMRDTTFVVAQVVTLGVIAMVLGLIALNALLGASAAAPPPTPQSGPSRPLTTLVTTIVASTPSPAAGGSTATPTLFVPPGFVEATATAARAEPTTSAEPTRAPSAQAPAPTATPRPPEPTAPPRPSPTAAAPAPTRAPEPSATPRPDANATGQLMKVLPAADGLPARVRAEPNTRSRILLRVPLGATVEVLGQASGDELQPGNARWLRIRWKDQTGWVYSSLIGE
jgi:hypothetical protein